MKITVDVECTPQEMRAFFGLPDLEPMQQAVMQELQRRMLTSLDQLSPTTMMKDWFGPMNNAVAQAFLGAFTPPTGTRRGPGQPRDASTGPGGGRARSGTDEESGADSGPE